MLRMLREPTPDVSNAQLRQEDAWVSRNGAAAASGNKKRLALVIAHLGAGGAQRVAATAANALVERGYEVHVVVLHQRPTAYEVDPRVVMHSNLPPQTAVFNFDAESSDPDLAPPVAKDRSKPVERAGLVTTYVRPNVRPALFDFAVRTLSPVLPVIRLVRTTITIRRQAIWLRRKIQGIEPIAVLSFLTQTNILTVLATRGLDAHTVISERNDPRLQRHRPRVEFLRRMVYRWADVVTANSKGALTSLESFVPKHKLAFLPNPLAIPAKSETAAFSAPTVITVGRLVEQKGIDVLLAAWAKVIETLPDWRLAIVGDGPLAPALKALAAKLKLENNVDWIGQVSDPFPLLRGSEFFVMTSRFEGTPNALLEAMSCGLPAVVTDASPGPCELIGIDESSAGLIVPVEDAGATAGAIIRLARDETLRRRLGLAARERVRSHDADHAIDVWLRLLRCE